MNHPVVTQTNIGEFPLISRGKVRDIYDIDDETLLIVTTDRMSAFDVIMSSPIPMKGVVLNQLTLFWMKRFSSLVPNHIKEADVDRYPAALRPYRDELAGRSLLAKKAKPLPVECIVRGYLAGSGWKDYRKNGEVCGHKLPAGLEESSKLPEPIFTPSTKAAIGQHDENISLREAEKILGVEKAHAVADLTMNIYRQASEYAAGRGIIIADTKFEFGMVDGELTLIDEVLTPDSSRFWPAKGYAPGRSQPSFDKQYLRDWLEQQPWDKTPPPPALPEDVVKTTTEKYLEAYHIITGSHIQYNPAGGYMLLEGKKALIMGVANNRSIAYGISSAFAREGARLAFSYAGDAIKKRVEPISEELGGEFTLPCDVSSDDDIAAAAELVKEKWGKIDVLVHSVAYAPKEELAGRYLDTSRNGFKVAMDISAYSLVALCRAFEPLMDAGSSVICMTYYGAQKLVPNYNVMGVAKAALEASVRYLASDLGARGVRINAISAGPIKTLAASGISDFRVILDHIEKYSPLRRNVTIDQVGNAALFLASDMASGVTGDVLFVDSGYQTIGLTPVLAEKN